MVRLGSTPERDALDLQRQRAQEPARVGVPDAVAVDDGERGFDRLHRRGNRRRSASPTRWRLPACSRSSSSRQRSSRCPPRAPPGRSPCSPRDRARRGSGGPTWKKSVVILSAPVPASRRAVIRWRASWVTTLPSSSTLISHFTPKVATVRGLSASALTTASSTVAPVAVTERTVAFTFWSSAISCGGVEALERLGPETSIPTASAPCRAR